MTEAKKLAKLVAGTLSGFEFWNGLNETERKEVTAAIEETLANTVPPGPINWPAESPRSPK